MYTPKNPHVPDTPTKKLKYLTALSFFAFILGSILVIVLSLQVVTKNNQLSGKQNEIETLAKVLEKTSDELTKSRRALIAQTALPGLDSFGAQCPEGNAQDGLFTILNETPIEGYNVFLVECRSNIAAGKSAPRIITFKVNNDGTKDFVYGTTDTEPLCIPSKIPVAAKIGTKLTLPVCAKS